MWGAPRNLTRYKNGRVEGVGYLAGSKVLAEVRNRGGRDQRSKKSIANMFPPWDSLIHNFADPVQIRI